MLPITIDISEAVGRLALSNEEVKSYSRLVLDVISDKYMDEWRSMVRKLGRTRTAYMNGMERNYIDDFNVEFVLNAKGAGVVAMMLERGASPFDMKDGFSKSSKKKTKEGGGWYLTIPFRHATSQAIGESMSGKLPNRVQQIAKKVGNVKVTDLPTQYQQKGVRREIRQGSIIIPEYVHKNPIYEGLTRKDISSTEKEKRGGYMTFRRVSDKTIEKEPWAWYHPGFQAKDFMGKAMDNLTKEFESLVDYAETQFLNAKEI